MLILLMCGLCSPHLLIDTYIHNVSVWLSDTTNIKLMQILNFSVVLYFVTTHWFSLQALLISQITKIRIWYFVFGSMKAENRSVSLLSEAGPACKMLASFKSL
jgi:hypothetical protein